MSSTGEAKSREFQSWASVVPGWRKHDERVTQTFGKVSLALLDKAGVKEGDSVLDVACGTGEPAIPAATRVGAKGRVFAIDFTAGMVDFARQKAGAAGLGRVEFPVVDRARLAARPASVRAE